MIDPAPAPVRPRVLARTTGEPVLLVDEIEPYFRERRRGAICIFGPPGSGKTTALAHVAASLPVGKDVALMDDGAMDDGGPHGLFVYTAPAPLAIEHLAAFALAPWGADECIEYLMALHPRACASVVRRLRRIDAPAETELLTIVLDRLAADESILDADRALLRGLDAAMTAGGRALAARRCLSEIGPWKHPESEGSDARLIRHERVRMLLAAEELAGRLREGRELAPLALELPQELVVRTAGLLDEKAMDVLHDVVRHGGARTATAASILFATPASWAPSPGDGLLLAGGRFPRARWPGVSLVKANLTDGDLHGAMLARARLDQAHIRGADLSGAQLHGASMVHATLILCNLSRARLCRADLRSARLFGANIEGADFSQASLDGADLSMLDLRIASFEGVTFRGARLADAILEELRLPGAQFEGASLKRAALTGSRMHEANFRGADLLATRLADIDWPGADLRDADLRGATFHMGTTRSGLLFGAPSEGTRTGFYTDEYYEQDFRAPEEIRKANLRGANLIGAILGDVDFYLVDLRDAQYTEAAGEHFRRCGAILNQRV